MSYGVVSFGPSQTPIQDYKVSARKMPVRRNKLNGHSSLSPSKPILSPSSVGKAQPQWKFTFRLTNIPF